MPPSATPMATFSSCCNWSRRIVTAPRASADLADSNSTTLLAICLSGIAISLLVVGAISDTLMRHVIQVVPLLVAAGLVLRRTSIFPYVAVGLCAFWAVVMALIWLYLLQVSAIASGTYSSAEISLTFVIAVFAVLGILRGSRANRQLSSPVVAVLAAVAFVLQGVFLAASLRLPA